MKCRFGPGVRNVSAGSMESRFRIKLLTLPAEVLWG